MKGKDFLVSRTEELPWTQRSIVIFQETARRSVQGEKDGNR